MAQIEAVLSSHEPLEQSVLSDISRQALRLYLQGSPDPPPLSQVEHIWHRLTLSTNVVDVNEKYLTAACNAISVFLTTCSLSQSNDLTTLAFSTQVWSDGYDCAQKAFDKGKTKPALQVLETLCRLLNENSSRHAAESILNDAIRQLLRPVIAGDLAHRIKVACITLSCFVRKTAVALALPSLTQECISEMHIVWTKHLQLHNLRPEDVATEKEDRKALFLALLMAIKSLETRSAALKLLTLICTNTRDVKESEDLFVSAATMLELYITRNSDVLGDFAHNVFPVILEDHARWQAFVDLFTPNNSDRESRLLQYLAVLRVGKVAKFVGEGGIEELLGPFCDLRSKSNSRRRMKYNPISQLMQASSGAVRIHTYDLLVTTPANNATISWRTLQWIAGAWKCLLGDNDAHGRGEILSISRRLLKRIDSRVTVLSSDARHLHEVFPMVDLYLKFLVHVVELLRQELLPGVSYSRHILALQTLQLFLGLPSSGQCELRPLCKPLLNLILDPFEDVRTISAEICRSIFSRPVWATDRPLLDSMAKHVESLSASTCRHDHADAAGLLNSLTFSFGSPARPFSSCLERLEVVSSLGALAPGSTVPVHALLLGATRCLSFNRAVSNKIAFPPGNYPFRACRRIWELVQAELCVDSPEGATADSLEQSTGPKDLLAYSWRALRDSNLLLQATLQAYKISHEVLSEAGRLCMEQLTQLRHRGAFSTVAQTFRLCCDLARSSSNAATRRLVQEWYRLAVEEIRTQAGKLTRRSAGLPTLINAMLSSDDLTFFDVVVQDLKSKASQRVALGLPGPQELELPQVHALNCIKDIIHNSRFRTVNERYLGELLDLSANVISSGVWPIRNSGLMLLNACMVRLEPNGSASDLTDNAETAQWTREEPLKVAVGLLERSILVEDASSENGNGVSEEDERAATPVPRSENIFAALDLVKYVGRASQESAHLHQLIRHHLKSHIWAIRDKAARVLVARSEAEGDLLKPRSILPLQLCGSENELHGHLLFFRYCLMSGREHYNVEEVNDSLEVLPDMLHTLEQHVNARSSPSTKAALLDIINDSLSFILSTGRVLTDMDTELLVLHRTLGASDNTHYLARLLLGKVMFYILEGSELTDRKFVKIGLDALEDLTQEMCLHVDEVKYVLDQLQATQPADTIAQMRLIDVLCRLFMNVTTADVRAQALSVLAEVLEKHEQTAGQFYCEDLVGVMAAMKRSFDSDCVGDRDFWNASLHIWAFYLRERLQLYHTIPTAEMEVLHRSAEQLLHQLYNAGQDVTEYYTRLSAAFAMRTCGPAIISLRMLRGARYTQSAMKALSLLYDQLNDDDEDIRNVAAQAGARVVHMWRGKHTHERTASSCPLASRETILELMLEPQGKRTSDKQHAVSIIAIRHIIGSNPARFGMTEASLPDILAESVAERLQDIYVSLNDLFAEERQNLYIDDLSEVALWSRALRQCGLHFSTTTSQQLLSWASEALGQIEAALKRPDAPHHFPLGPTYNSEVLMLFVKVISLASVLVELSHKHENHGDRLGLVTRLRALEVTCAELEVHDRVTAAFSAGMEAEDHDELEQASPGQP